MKESQDSRVALIDESDGMIEAPASGQPRTVLARHARIQPEREDLNGSTGMHDNPVIVRLVRVAVGAVQGRGSCGGRRGRGWTGKGWRRMGTLHRTLLARAKVIGGRDMENATGNSAR